MPSRSYIKLEGRLSLAIQEYSQGKPKSFRAVSRSYEVPFSSLYTRYYGISLKRDTT